LVPTLTSRRGSMLAPIGEEATHMAVAFIAE
jgi:hypothetical protein